MPNKGEFIGVKHRFVCSLCGEKAGVVQLVPSELGPVVMVSSFVCRSSHPVDGRKLDRARRAISEADAKALYRIDTEITPFFCPACNACYCGQHWKHWDVIESDGWYDCSRGICPEGHERMLVD